MYVQYKGMQQEDRNRKLTIYNKTENINATVLLQCLWRLVSSLKVFTWTLLGSFTEHYFTILVFRLHRSD